MASWQAFKHAQVGQEWAKGSAVTAGTRQYLPVLFPQVTENYGLPIRAFPNTLSRWRHGFEPRWDYQGKRMS